MRKVRGRSIQVRPGDVPPLDTGAAPVDCHRTTLYTAGERLVIIDLPQVVDLVGNPAGPDFLLRDCTNVCTWFRARGLEVDEHDLFAELLAHGM